MTARCVKILSFILFLFVFSTHVYGLRGISVQLKTDKGKTAEKIKLYGGSYALLIGVSDYTAWPSLESIPGELARVEKLLKNRGFVVEKHLDPDSKTLPRIFEKFIDNYGYEPENRILFYYAGHGHTRKNGAKGYLVPVDAPNPNKDDRGFVRKALNMNLLVSWARDIEAKHALFLFDSCFSGTIFKQRDLPTPTKYITKMTTEQVRLFITAGKAGETVPARSTFTPVFIKALEYGLADVNGDGYVTGTELGAYLQEQVPEHADQSPQFGKIRDYDLSLGDFIFLARGDGPDVGKDARPVYSDNQKKGMLKISSTPSAARVRVDGKSAGETPVELNDLTPGRLQVSVAKKGYETITRRVSIREGRRSVLHVELEKRVKKGWLTVNTSPPNAAVRIVSGEKYQPGVELIAGRYQLEVSAEGYYPLTKEVVVGDGDDLNISLHLKVKKKPAENITSDGMEFVLVKGGCFQMGDTFGEGYNREKPVHEVCVDDFYLGKYEVTQGEWQQVMGNNPSHFKKGDRCPVESVSWNDVQDYIRKLNKRSGRTYRLPTEAEWEYAARSGGKREKYAGSNSVGDVAWHGDNSGGTSHRVGTKKPNGLGLYDMSGNVWEWCQDWYGEHYYSSSPRQNPIGPVSGEERVFRGGGWRNSPGYVRAANRRRFSPGITASGLGFRLSLSVQQQASR